MFVDFGKKVHDRCARCDENEVFSSVRKVTIGDKSVDGVGDGGLISGCQIPVNPTMKSCVTQCHKQCNCLWASSRYRSAPQTTNAPPLSAGLITMSLRARRDLIKGT